MGLDFELISLFHYNLLQSDVSYTSQRCLVSNTSLPDPARELLPLLEDLRPHRPQLLQVGYDVNPFLGLRPRLVLRQPLNESTLHDLEVVLAEVCQVTPSEGVSGLQVLEGVIDEVAFRGVGDAGFLESLMECVE